MSDASTIARHVAGARKVKGSIAYIKDMAVRPRFYANDHSRDVLDLDLRTVDIEDARLGPVDGAGVGHHASSLSLIGLIADLQGP